MYRISMLDSMFTVSFGHTVVCIIEVSWILIRVGKNPGFFKKTQPSGFFWVFLGFFGFFGFFCVFLGFFAQTRGFLGFFFQFHDYFRVHPDFKL
jgi:hypothetical protein